MSQDILRDLREHARKVARNPELANHSYMEDAADEIEHLRTENDELRMAAYDYARMIQVENFDRNDIAVHRAYERLRKALPHPYRPAPRTPS